MISATSHQQKIDFTPPQSGTIFTASRTVYVIFYSQQRIPSGTVYPIRNGVQSETLANNRFQRGIMLESGDYLVASGITIPFTLYIISYD